MSALLLLDHIRKLQLQSARIIHSTLSVRKCSDDKKNKPQKNDEEPQPTEKSDRLNQLLKAMIEDKSKRKYNIEMAQPAASISKKKKEERSETKKKEDPDVQIILAAKEVASTFGGDTKRTESELLSKLLGVATTEANDDKSPLNLTDLIVGMKIDRTKTGDVPGDNTHSQQVRRVMRNQHQGKDYKSSYPDYKKHQRENNMSVLSGNRVDLFSGEPIGIFKVSELSKDEHILLPTWDKLAKRELKLAVMHPPENYFQKMILWTEQGKLWKFPIDNEQGMDDEANIYFTEHVFLDTHLESWCPTKGPIRHFMELVCTGLSKNYHITVKDKKNHIEWFKKYFENKQELLDKLGVGTQQLNDSNKHTSIAVE